MSRKSFIIAIMSFILGLVTLFATDKYVFLKKGWNVSSLFDKNDKFTADALKSENSKLTLESIGKYTDAGVLIPSVVGAVYSIAGVAIC